MKKNLRSGSVAAVMHEYERAIDDLKQVIKDITPAKLSAIVDPDTENPNCLSIQTILTHVVTSGYYYSIYIGKLKDPNLKFPDPHMHQEVAGYITDLDKVLKHTGETMKNLSPDELNETEQQKKIRTRWGQYYSVDQMLEHAIVHILRHRFQIEKFKVKLGI
jgi:uncharacterized damage-inducible protein DinB